MLWSSFSQEDTFLPKKHLGWVSNLIKKSLFITIGIVSKVYDESSLVDEAVKLGQDIGKFSQLAIASAKEAVLKGKIELLKNLCIFLAEDLPLTLGLDYERKLFHGTFATV